MNTPRFFRRRDIVRLAPGLVAAVFLERRRARAATGKLARLLVMYTPNGAHDARWIPTGTGTDFKLPKMLAALETIRPHVVLTSGIRHVQHNENPGAGDQHDQGIYQMLTGCRGVRQDNAAWAGGISVDQYVAERIGAGARRRSLELGVYSEKDGPLRKATDRNVISYRAAMQPLVPVIDPWASLTLLFEGITTDPAAAQAVTEVKRRRRRLLDFLRTDLATLRAEVRGDERLRMDEFAGSLDEVERILLPPAAAPAPAVACGPGALGSKPAGSWKDQNFALVADAQIKIALAALRCDVTRVVSLMFAMAGGGSGDPTFDFAPVGVKERHHELSHKLDQASKDLFDRIHDHYARQYVKLVTALQQTPDARGGTMLDSTLVWWTTDLGNAASHAADDVQQVLAGGGLVGGRHLAYARTPHNKLLTSICHAAGIDTPGFGEQRVSTGPLPGLF